MNRVMMNVNIVLSRFNEDMKIMPIIPQFSSRSLETYILYTSSYTKYLLVIAISNR